MTDMTLAEVAEAKARAEAEIRDVLMKLETSTTLRVQSVTWDSWETWGGGGGNGAVCIDLRMP
jgi:hypothetical protein